jgi:hypothetical protein
MSKMPRRSTIVMLGVAVMAMACNGVAPAQSAKSAVPSPAARSIATNPVASPTTSTSPLPEGRLVFERFIGDNGSTFTSNPDGTDVRPLVPAGLGGGRWSPDGRHISVVADNRQRRLFVGLVDPDGSHYVQFDSPDPTLDLGCIAW